MCFVPGASSSFGGSEVYGAVLRHVGGSAGRALSTSKQKAEPSTCWNTQGLDDRPFDSNLSLSVLRASGASLRGGTESRLLRLDSSLVDLIPNLPPTSPRSLLTRGRRIDWTCTGKGRTVHDSVTTTARQGAGERGPETHSPPPGPTPSSVQTRHTGSETTRGPYKKDFG